MTCNLKQENFTFKDLVSYFKTLNHAERMLMSEVVKLIKLVIVMPATNASSERSFSALRRLKSYLRATMTQKRLNNYMVLHIHKEIVDKLSLTEVANYFTQKSDYRRGIFGTFTDADL